jgi:uroporphyrinogen decarboxylase
MNRKDRVLAALNHEDCFPIPYHIEFTAQSLKRLRAYAGDANIERATDTCLHYIQYWGWPTELPDKPEHFRDEFGVVWNRSGADKDIGIVDDLIIKDIEDNDYEFPVPDTARLRRDLEALVNTKGGRFTMMGFGFCMYERSWSLMGMENVLAGMVASPDALEDLFDRICDFYIPLIDIALEYDIDGMYFGDDWGQQHGLIMGPAHWRRFIKPRMARLYERVKRRGKYILQHSCGDCHELFPDFIEIGMDCYQTFQPEVYDIAEMKRLYGKNISFWGGISTQRAMPNMTPDELKEEIKRVVRVMRPGGGFIAAPTHAIPQDVPPENILAMAEMFTDQEKYFL